MKLIVAIIQPQKLEAVKEALNKVEVFRLTIVDVQAIECPSGSCDAQIDGVPIYEDENHINGYASVRLTQQYLSRFGNPLRR